jgi:hypothetical protein
VRVELRESGNRLTETINVNFDRQEAVTFQDEKVK